MWNDKNNIDLSKDYLTPMEARKIAMNLDAIERARNPEYGPLSVFILIYGSAATFLAGTVALIIVFISDIEEIAEDGIEVQLVFLVLLLIFILIDCWFIKVIVQRFRKR